ncbi:MAG: hypothetical protein EXR70_10650 [Deltaproteobacteria bacterium]|nr:hypothetical protein [Deltaproteobacteria bacterium]
MKYLHRNFLFTLALLLSLSLISPSASAQSLDKVRLGNSGTGINVYLLDIGKRMGLFRKHGIDLEAIYVNSGSLLNQALMAGTFDMVMSQGSEAMLARLRGADLRMNAVVANRFNHVYIAGPTITAIKQLKGKRVAVSRFGSGSHFQTNLALKDGGLDPEKDVTVLQIGNSAARMAAILGGTVDGTIMAADFVPRAKKAGFNILADLTETKIEYPFLSVHMLGSYTDRNLRVVKAVIKAMSESIRALQSDPTIAKAAIRAAPRCAPTMPRPSTTRS